MTSYQEKKFQRTLYPVRKETYFDIDGKEKGRIVREDTLEELAKVSKGYRLIPNASLVMPFVEQFGTPEVKVGSGNKSHIYIFHTKREFDLGDGDIIKERLIIRNSYNKSKAYEFMFGAFRLVCTNGLYTGVSVFNYKKIHVGEIPVERMVNETLEGYKDNRFDLWQQFKKISLTEDEQIEILNNWKPFETREGKDGRFTRTEVENCYIINRAKYLVKKPESLDNQRNAWGLFNQMNQAIRTEYRFQRSKESNKSILGDLRSEKYLSEVLGVK